MRLEDFNYFDWTLVAIVIVSMGLAFRRGLVRAIFGLLGFIGGFLMATWFYTDVGEWVLACRIKMSVQTARIVAFVAIVLVMAILIDQAGRFLQRFLRTVGLGLFDRVLGMAFGFARGCMLAIAVLMLATTVLPQSDAVANSALTPYLFAVSHDVSFLVPEYLQELMASGAFNLNHNSPVWINRH
ncbi:MAG TPA: CvpA family protein [Acidobacteriaceae bacterium]|jgi:membrane protein required for colicin V production|nr:CvpA family protein [Acidobacteriaceae bacterium]